MIKHQSITTSEEVLLILADHTICAANSGAGKLLGYSLSEVENLSFNEFWGRTINEAGSLFTSETNPVIVALETGKPSSNILMGFHKPNGSLIWLVCNFQPLFQAGKSQAYAVVATFREYKQRTEQQSRQTTPLEPDQVNKIATELGNKNSVLQAIIEGTSDVIFAKDLQGRYVIANHTACEWLSISAEEIVGKGDTELFPPEVANNIMKMDRQVISTGKPIIYTEKLPKQGMLKTLHSIKYPWISPQGNIVGVIGISRDITEREYFEQALRESESSFLTLVETIPHLVWISRPDGYVEYFNQRWCEYIGMSLEESLGWNWTNALHPDDRQKCLNIWHESLRTGKDYKIEYRLQSASKQKYCWFLGQAIPLKNDSGKIIKWFGSCTDIDEHKHTEKKIEKALQQAQKACQKAETANRLKDEFLAVLSHELRTPLNPILGWIQIIQRPNIKEDRKLQGLQVIERNTKLQINLVEDLLDISRLMRGKLTLKTLPVNLESVIRSSLDTVRLAAENKAIKIESSFIDSTLEVNGDEVRLQQVLWNLLSNAIKFTDSGGQVSVSLERNGAMAQITVSDTGKGIKKEFLPYIFQYFRQEEASISRNFGGLGLGLAIARNLVEMHGGTIEVFSLGEGQGATFTVSLPLLTCGMLISPENQTQNVSKDLSGVHILVVDDDADCLELIKFDLQMYGAEVTAVSSASAAIEVLSKLKIDVLVSDIGMPKMDGYEMLRQIRACKLGNNSGILAIRGASPLRAIALTAYAGEQEKQKAKAAGFDMHISKPVEIGVVAIAIAKLYAETKIG